MIKTLDQLVEKALSSGRKYRISVAWPHDENTLSAVNKAVKTGFADAVLIGSPAEIRKSCLSANIDPESFEIVEAENEIIASTEAVRMAKVDYTDIVMKGLVGTDKFLKAVMHKETGIMIPDAVLSYVGAIQIPSYHKLLFVTDTAVIPSPDLEQKIAMAVYAVEMADKFGINKPKIALIGASEKLSDHFESSADYTIMKEMAACGQINNCIMDGPLDIFLACDRNCGSIKGIDSPINGDADILLFPSLESSNPFYKALMLFAGGEIAGLIRGTRKPVVVMSRSESGKSKYYCIALACLMAN